MSSASESSEPGVAVACALDSFQPGARTGAAKPVKVGQTTLSRMYAAIGGGTARAIAPRVLVDRSGVSSPCVVDASAASAVYIAAPVFVLEPPGAPLEHLVVATPPSMCTSPRLALHITRLRASRVDISVNRSAFVIDLINAMMVHAEDLGVVRIHVYGSPFTRAVVASWLLNKAVADSSVCINDDGLSWTLGSGLHVKLEPMSHHPPLWAFSAK